MLGTIGTLFGSKLRSWECREFAASSAATKRRLAGPSSVTAVVWRSRLFLKRMRSVLKRQHAVDLGLGRIGRSVSGSCWWWSCSAFTGVQLNFRGRSLL